MSNRFFPWGLKLGGGGSNNAGTLSLINKLPANATFTGGEQYCEDYQETLKTAGADQAQFPGMRLVTTVADGALLGPELVVNGGFDTDTDWTKVVATISNGEGHHNGSGMLYQIGIIVSGKTYQVVYSIVSWTSGGTINIGIGGSSPRTTAQNSIGTFSEEIVSSGTSIYCYGTNAIASIDNISVREVIPTWLPTASDGARNHPTISGVPQFYPNRQEYEDVGPTSEFRTTKGDTTESLDHYYESDETQELVTNGNNALALMTVDSGYVRCSAEQSAEQSYSNSFSAKITNTFESNPHEFRIFTVVGKTYKVSAYFYIPSTTTPTFAIQSALGAGQVSTALKDQWVYLETEFEADYTYISIGELSSNDPGAIWYVDNLSVKIIPKTSLTPLPRDSEGRFYENLVKNGGFDVDAEWPKGTGWTIGSGVVSYADASYNNLVAQYVFEVGKTYTVSFDFVSSLRSVRVYLGTSSDTAHTISAGTTGRVSVTAIAEDVNLTIRSSTPLTADLISIDNVSVIEVDALGNPTNIVDGGWRENTTNHLLNSGTPATQTTGSLSTGWYSLLTWGNTGSVAVTAGTATISGLTGAASDTVPAYFEVTGVGTVTVTETGTVDKFQLSGGVCSYHQANYIETTSATVTQPANVDDAVVWQYAGRYQDRVGYLSEAAATNLFLNSQAPITQTIDLTAIGTGDYSLSTYGTGTATVAAGTATGTGFGASSDGTDITFNLSVVGTVVVTIAGGPPDWVQVEAGSFATSPIITVASTVTRPATVCEIPSGRYIRANDFAAQGYCIPEGAGQTGTIWSSYTDANNYTSLGISATQVILNKRISGTSHTATVTYSHAADTWFEWQAFFDSTDGIGLRTREWDGLVWGAWEFFATDATATDIAVPANIQIGSIDDGAQFNGTLPHIAFKKTNNPRLYFVDQQEFKTSGGETFKTSDGDTFIVYGD